MFPFVHSLVTNCFEECNNVFIVLKTVKPEKGIIKRRNQLKSMKNSMPSVCKTDMGLPFYILETADGKKGIDWNTVSRKCGRYASRIVASHSVSLPDNSGLKRFIPISMNAILVFNTALKIIGSSDLPADRFAVTVTDRNAVTPSRLRELLPFSSAVKIITSHPEKFAAAAMEAYESHGASLMIRSRYEPSDKPEVIVCCDGAIMSSMDGAAIFTSKKTTVGKLRFVGKRVELSDYHKSIIPDDIETVDFAGALTELCGSGEYRQSSFAELETSCDECEDRSPEKCLGCFIGNKAVT